MKKYTKLLLFGVILLFISLLLINNPLKMIFVDAEETTDYEEYLKSIVTEDNYNETIESIIKNRFSNFNIDPLQFDNLVPGKSNYRILEITPRNYTDNISEISDLEYNINEIKDIYQAITIRSDYTDKNFIANMPNFNLDVMTVKQFVDNRDELDGKYDAILFSAGDYSEEQVLSCDFSFDYSDVIYKNIYGKAHRFIYQGYMLNNKYHGYGKLYDAYGNVEYEGEFKNGLFHGHGKRYHNGNLVYEGGFLDGYQSCFGISYDSYNHREKHRGHWRRGHKEGYGISIDEGGFISYHGYFHNDQRSPDYVPRDILNEITELKAEEIINDYLLKGLPVFVNDDAKSFTDYLENTHPNETFSNLYMLNYNATEQNSNIDFYTTLSIMKITELLSDKANIEFIEKPIDFDEDPTHTYFANEVIDFKLKLTNRELADLLFYIDINQNEIFEEDELAYTIFIQNGVFDFEYKIPTTYSGILRYKIVVNTENKTSLYNGSFKVKGEYKEIKVLNVVSQMVDWMDGLLDDDLYYQYFQNNGDYNITMDRCNIKDFSKNNYRKWECSHYTVMDDYDVILLGQDIFDKGMNTHVYNSIQEQINNGKPVIFTSSVTKGNQKWVNYFQDDLSLDSYRTDLYKLNNNVNKLQIVNKSNYTLYPYDMNNEALLVPEDLNYALNEQYQVNLNNPDLVPLMNMYNSDNPLYDRFDSYNNFYYMKHDNVIYLNVGNNSFKVYKDIEHKLLVNSIVNSYIEYKAKDQKVDDFFSIENTNTFENMLIDVNDHVQFSFSIFSNKNNTYNYTLYADSNEIQTDTITNNQLIDIDLSNFASPNINTIQQVYIYVEIENDEHETHTYGFYVFVGNLDTYNVTLYPTVLNSPTVHEGEKYLQVNNIHSYTNNYRVELNNIDVTGLDVSKLPEEIIIENMMFSQEVPDNIIIDDPNYTITDKTISKYLGNFTYTLVGNYYVPDSYIPLNFTVPFIVTETGDYTFEPATLTFDGIGSDSATIQNSNVTFNAIKPLDSSMVTPIFEDYLFIPFGEDRISDLTKKFIISDEAMVKSINFNTIGTVLELDGNILEANSIGEQYVEIVVEDIFGNVVRKSFLVLSYVPITTIDLDDQSLFVDESITLPFIIDTKNIKFELIEQTDSANVVQISRLNNQFIITGLEKGYAHYRFYGYDSDGYEVSTVISIVVNEVAEIYFNDYFMSLFKDEMITANDMINNVRLISSYTLGDVVFISHDDTIASIVNGSLVAHKPGTVVIDAVLPNNESAQLLVKVYDYIGDNSGFDPNLDSIKIYQGYKQYLENFIKLDPDSLSSEDVVMEFTIDDPNDILEYFDPITNTFNTKVDKYGNITVHVTIKQLNRAGEVVKTITDTYVLTIREIVDPNIDKGDNTH
ncbi:hypothetical protein KHQ81_05610 [Mycoplasmatota bacterium]|nr:hypothetical protein KHQ81_05610 [Mycoplasmatota bacterium]